MDNLITLYQQRLNLRDALFSRIAHEDTMVAVVYKITQSTGIQDILKVCTRAKDYFREIYFLKHFANTLPVPLIIQTVHPEPDVNGAILMEYLPGELLNIQELSDKLAYEIGALLARIHLNRVPGYGDLTQPHALTTDPHVYFTSKLEEHLAECSSHLPKALLDQCRRYYDKHLNLLDSLDGPCIVHRDFRPGNMIVYNGKLKGIIDWASACASFAEEDFCSMEHGVWPVYPRSKELFLAGYKSIRPVPDYSPIMPLLRLNKALAAIGFTVKHDTWTNSNARLYQFNRQFLKTFF